jgi:hypothetical protein
MSAAFNPDTAFVYRKSLQPLGPMVGASCIVNSPLLGNDNWWGADSFSIQLNAGTLDNLVLQDVLQVLGNKSDYWNLQAGKNGTLTYGLRTKAPPIAWEGVAMKMKRIPGSGWEAHLGVFGPASVWDNASHGFLMPYDVDLYFASVPVVGYGGGSNTTFTSGSAECSVSVDPSIDDLAVFFGTFPDFACKVFPGIAEQTIELSNMTQMLEALAPFEARFTTSVFTPP